MVGQGWQVTAGAGASGAARALGSALAYGDISPGRNVTRQPFLPVASVVFAAFAPCLTVDFKLYSCDNL